MQLIHAISLLITTWFVIGMTCVGIGGWLWVLWGQQLQSARQIALAFFAGYAVIAALLQVAHFGVPIDATVASGLVSIGLLSLWPHRRSTLPLLRRITRKPIWALLFAALALLLAYESLPAADWIDTGAYHVPSIVWINEYPLLPGFANINPHFGLSSTYFLYAAALNWGPLAERVTHIANGPLLLGGLVLALVAARRVFASKYSIADVMIVVFTPELSRHWVINTPFTLSSDIPVLLLGIIMLDLLVRNLQTKTADADASFRVKLIVLLAATGLATKLSIAAFAVSAAALAYFVHCFDIQRIPLRLTIRLVAITSFVLMPWVARNAIASGYPLYPLPALSLPVDWRIPDNVPDLLADTIYLTEDDSRWFDLIFGHFFPLTTLPLIIGSLSMGIALFWRRSHPRVWLAFLPLLAALLYWLAVAPRVRYANGMFSLFAGLALGLLVVHIPDRLRTKAGRAGLVLVIIAGMLIGIPRFERYGPGPDDGFYPVRVPILRTYETTSGLAVSIPQFRGECWYAEIPCSRFAMCALALRNPDSFSDGFQLESFSLDQQTCLADQP